MKTIPWLTVGISIVMIGMFSLPSHMQAAIHLNTQEWMGLSILAWVSGHFIHADAQHLIWNVTAFLVLGGIIELRSKTQLLLSLCVGILAVNVLLASPFSNIHIYCGLSGALNTLLGLTLWILWKETQNKILIILAVANILKIIFELTLGVSLFTHISWPAYSLSHLVGFVASFLLIIFVDKVDGDAQSPKALSASF